MLHRKRETRTSPSTALAVLLALTTTATAALTVPTDSLRAVSSPIDERSARSESDLDAAEKKFEDDLRSSSNVTLAYLGLSSIKEQRGDLIGALQFARMAIENLSVDALGSHNQSS